MNDKILMQHYWNGTEKTAEKLGLDPLEHYKICEDATAAYKDGESALGALMRAMYMHGLRKEQKALDKIRDFWAVDDDIADHTIFDLLEGQTGLHGEPLDD